MTYRDAFVAGFLDALKLFIAIVGAPFKVMGAFIRHQDFRLRTR